MDKLYVKAKEFELMSTEDKKIILYEEDEMVDDLYQFKIKVDIQDGDFCLEVKRIKYDVAEIRIIDEVDIRQGNIALSGDSLLDVYLKFIKDDGSFEVIENIYGFNFEWYHNNEIGGINISMHGSWYDNALELGQTEEDWLKSKI